jgi:hypothetical protein
MEGRANEIEEMKDAEAEHSKETNDGESHAEVDDRVFPHPNDEWEAQDAASVLALERSLGGAVGACAEGRVISIGGGDLNLLCSILPITFLFFNRNCCFDEATSCEHQSAGFMLPGACHSA